MRIRNVLMLILMTVWVYGFSQKADYFNPDLIRYDNFVYKSNIQTVELHKYNINLSQPILDLHGNDTLALDFDDFDVRGKKYSYTVVHCSYNWQPSDLSKQDYINGYADNPIDNYRFSINTRRQFTHYQQLFPNENIQFTKSGNYLLVVYEDGNVLNLVLTRRFRVVDHQVGIDAKVIRPLKIEDAYKKQEVDFSLDITNANVSDARNEVKVVLMQNYRYDNALYNLQPNFVQENMLSYTYENNNIFPGGNEYRFFDLKSVKYQSVTTARIFKDSGEYQIWLYNDLVRSNKSYLSNKDINGDRLIYNSEATDNNLESDYVYVHFALPYPNLLVNGNLYVFGALSDWTVSKANRLKYNVDRKMYEATILVKQGYYNYSYVYVEDNAKYPDESLIEGSFYETENDYTVLVYKRLAGSRYDELVGINNVSSRANY